MTKFEIQANFEQVKYRYINGIDILILGRKREKPNKLCSCYLGNEPELPKSFPAIRDGNGKPKTVFPLFGNGNSSSCQLEP